MFVIVMQANDILDDFDFDANGHPIWADEGEVVAKFYSPLEAEMAAARLRSEGIHCFLANTISQTVLPHLQIVARLHVRPVDSARAREILHQAVIETATPVHSDGGKMALFILSVLIGLILALILVRAMWGDF
jgi:Putative prokaryotic signal transducing protein